MKIHIPSAASNIVDGNSPPSDIQAKEVSFPPPEIPAPGTPAAPVLLTPEQIRQQRDYAIHFMQYTIRALGATVVFGLSVAAAVISGGAGLPIAILAGAALVIAIGDACAVRIIIINRYVSKRSHYKPPVIALLLWSVRWP